VAGSSSVAFRYELLGTGKHSWATTGSMQQARATFTATLLNNGEVLVVGGENPNTRLSSAELDDPSSGGFTVTGSLPSARTGFSATLLSSGEVLLAGGYTAALSFPEWNAAIPRPEPSKPPET
jgi:hypothetical protein